MKRSFKTSLCTFLLFILCQNSFSQSQRVVDSLYQVRKNELLEAVIYDYNLIKMDLAGLAVGSFNFSYERRHNLNFSFLGDLSFNPTRNRKGWGASAGIRYYYNLEKHILDNWHKYKQKTSCLEGDYFQTDLAFFNRKGEVYQISQQNGVYVAPVFKVGRQKADKKNRFFYDAWIGYQIPLPDPRPIDARGLITFGMLRFGFSMGFSAAVFRR